ncbi:hypothetical protein ACJIZ3_015487 [Penstemon smallii]|uniref:Autophagy-related protein 2 n=1 Tax=Penstemon smallii TaxID=265156 RepID=A0ABD3RMM5_9LAMI
MFSWSIAKSAEALFSRWAIKRVCKFLLKKKLGKFILGDIDLNQLDVQLSAGKIQLSDLALNVDYINQKFGAASAILVKEGSVGSLVVTMPWKDGGCRIEVDELEVVLAPRRTKDSQDESDTCSQNKSGKNSFSHGYKKIDHETINSGMGNASVEVHEGVKTIAKMVKWLLTSFHVKIKKLIVAFDPFLEEESKKVSNKILVLRICEAECGTHISEDASPSSVATVHNFLGLSRLMSFVKFQGAVLELLNVDGLDHQSVPERSPEINLGNWFTGHCSPGNMTTVISGEKGGFSGNLSLNIPWKNGSLDIHKVDADFHIDPLELRLQPSTVRCFIFMWDLFKGIGEESEEQGHPEPPKSTPSSRAFPSDKELLGSEGFATNCYLMEKEPKNVLLSDSHLISDWVSRSQKDRYEEPDFGASVHQFFECCDELRNSQSALGNSGMWNWTCSVFSAITAASNLASGSLHVPSEQQHVETKFNATIAKVSLLLSFIDEDQKHYPMKDDKANTDNDIQCVCAQFVDLFLVFQVRPREMNFELTVHHVQLVDHFCSKNDLGNEEHGRGGDLSSVALIREMQDGVQGALRTFLESSKIPGKHSVDISLSTQGINRCCHMTNSNYFFREDTSITLLKTSGVSRCHARVNSGSSGGSLMGPSSFSLNLPPFVCWVNFDLVTMILRFLKEMTNCMETTRMGSGCAPESATKSYGLSPPDNQVKKSHPRATIMPTKTDLETNIFLPNARIILCFPLRECTDLSNYSSCNQFIAFEFISPATGGNNVQSAKTKTLASFNKRHNVAASCSLHLNVGDFRFFSISAAARENNNGSGTYSAEKITSFANGTGHLSLISMFWQEDTVTGPWIAKKAKLLASSENAKTEDKVVRNGFEFASVTTIKDTADSDARTRQEILSSSAFFLHGQLPPVTINLGKSQYDNLCGLLIQMFEHFSSILSESVRSSEEDSASQSSILVECDSVTVSVAIEAVEDVKCSMFEELPGSWLSLTLQLDKFELLSVSDIGGIRSANFLWMAHGQGNLWGSITEGLHREFLLISCSDSTMGRGDGESSYVLSSRYSGSDIINMWDPESNHNLSSMTVRCATIVAVGGRLDWFSTIISFFNVPSSEFEHACDNSQEKTCGSSLNLNLVDVGLSYEPYFKNSATNEGLHPKLPHLNANGATRDEPYVACLLAASTLKFSNTTLVDCTEGKYKIKLQDVGLLICTVSESKLVGNIYNAEHLRKNGYVKVAQEAHIEALLSTNCKNGHAWELECTESHIMLSTCHDTTFGLIRLVAQLQKLFAPDMQKYAVHLENRWNNAQQAQFNNAERNLGGEFSPSVSQTPTSSLDKRSKVGNLMDEVWEDVFQLDGNSNFQAKFFESRRDSFVGASGASSSEEKIPEFIDEYFLSDLRPLSELTLKSQSSDILHCKTSDVGETRTGNGGWYGDHSFKILENHASKVDGQNDVGHLVEVDASTGDSKHVDVEKAEGQIHFKNMNVTWRMYGGSDWSKFQNTSQPSAMNYGRDLTACLELEFSGIRVDYDVYPAGEIRSSSLSLTIRDFCLNDKSECAPWKLVLGNYQSKKHPRKFSSKSVKLSIEAVKPDPSIPLEENRLRIALLPMRLHLHQSQLDFLISFFGGKSSSADTSPNTPPGIGKPGGLSETSDNIQGCSISEEAFLNYFQASRMTSPDILVPCGLSKFDIWPMLIRVDYSPSRVDLTALRGGNYVELVNLVPWKGVELQLKHVQGVGLYGWNSVCETILGEWLEDISHNQIHKLLKGLAPIKSLVSVGSGAAKLVSLPVKNYKKDHRLLKGMQRGTIAFLRSISLEAIGLGVHLAAGAHNILLQAEYILTSIPPSVPWPVESILSTNVRTNQPKDAQQGIQQLSRKYNLLHHLFDSSSCSRQEFSQVFSPNEDLKFVCWQACQSISDGLGKSASALVQTPLKRYQHGAGMGSALTTAAQAAPAAAIAPASAAARAMHCALLGFRNSLDLEHKKESLEKYLGRIPPPESML